MKKIIPDEVAGYINMTCNMDERRENVVYEDDFFICVKDVKHKSETNYHYVAWCKKDLRSLLDLEILYFLTPYMVLLVKMEKYKKY